MSSSESTDLLNTSENPASEGKGAAPLTPESAATPPTPAADALAAAKKEAADNYDRYLRAVADLENFRRRTTREKDDLRQFAAARVLEDLLPVMDNLSLALKAAKHPGADAASVASGVEMVLTQLKTGLANHGLKEVDPAGQLFDANFHEAVSAQPSQDVPEGHVQTVVRTGYVLNGRLLRPATVVVSSGAPKQEGQKS
ncbi:nucleotide exchange factor GrpE [Opitutus terrae]|uniref:Protein GrpE n=1 Tax=Opitutus terrae (strain DSM 11246 / JCM 15787 / PB90-1) TaxID=452637 RepID=B1ZUR9_OPITP|nr:nucleotide exchange factor GrpE [Opitutus terrae]ACB74953.1 GrpE protein [Opitutus terrae PB90-1]